MPIRPFPSKDRLHAVQEAGVIVVGTSGDNPPFSLHDAATGKYSGIDVELALMLGEALGVRVEFARTSWPTVMKDLHDNLYDIGMSGIVYSPERARTATFSDCHIPNNKHYLIRAADKARFPSNASLDQAGVRVATNNGGTNEKFLRENIRHATISTVRGHNYEEQLVARLVAGEIDSWFVDAPHGAVAIRSEPSLYLLPEPAQRTHYAMLLHQSDPLLLNYVNLWLAELRTNGTLGRYQRAVDELVGLA